jgi:DNA polymerase (family 10)
MINKELAKIFYQIAEFLELEGEKFKSQAYEKAALMLETMSQDVKEIYEKGGKEALKEIKGVGESIAEKIEEYIKTGKIKYYEDFKKKLPFNLDELTKVEGLGPKRAKFLYEKLGIKNLKDLEEAVKKHKIRGLFGFGEKTERNILQAINFLKKSTGRFLLGEILPLAREIEEKLKSLKEVKEISMAGSLRRKKETIGDVDLLVISSNPQKVMDFFVSLPNVIKVWGKGPTRSSVRTKEGFDVDLRILPEKSYGAGLQYFTGSKEHNIFLRRIAIEKGFKLSEYGLFKGKKMVAGKNEEDIYHALGMDWIPPEMRENQGEIEMALSHSLPKIIDLKDIKGDLHCHSDWDGGENSIEEIAQRAREMGYSFVGISDHTKFLKIEHGLDERALKKRNAFIDKLNLKFKNKGLKILKSCEANILNDGRLDISDSVLKELDLVIAGIHSNFKMTKEKMTERIIRAMKNPYLNIISHPTGRILKRRDEYQIDFDKILRAAKEFKVVLEINSWPERLDLSAENIRRAKKEGVKMVINSDSHQIDQMRFIEYGVYQARRGFAEKEDIINTWPLEKMLDFLKK